MKPTRAILFDAGHTLVYAHPSVAEIYSIVSARHGARIPPEAFREAFVPIFNGFVKEYQDTDTASDPQDVAMWREITSRLHRAVEGLGGVGFEAWFENLYATFGRPELWRLYDDVVPVLGELRARGLKLSIVSNWDTRLRRIADGNGLAGLVDRLVISAEEGVRKPNPRIFERALARAGVAPHEAMHVGDLVDEDVEGARRAGVTPVLIQRDRPLTSVDAPPGVRAITSLRELLD